MLNNIHTQYSADPGKARDCSSNTIFINCLFNYVILSCPYNAAMQMGCSCQNINGCLGGAAYCA